MSYNIDHVDTPVLKGWMLAKDVVKLSSAHEGNMPECNFLDYIHQQAVDALADGEPGRKIKLPNLWWYGEGSGWAYDLLKEKIAPKVGGHVEAIFTWEGGDSETALVIKDGEVTEGDVEKTIKPKRAKR